MGNILGIEVGGTHTRLGLVSNEGILQHFIIEPTAQFNSEYEAPSLFLRFIRNYVDSYAVGRSLDAICAGFPSLIDRKRRTVIETPNIHGLDNFAAADLLEKEFGVPVYIERDVCLLLYHDMQRFHIPNSGITAGIYFGTGIGCAIAIDGSVLLGKHGVNGELGHVPLPFVKGNCGCENESCAEILIGGRAFEKMTQTAFPNVNLCDIFLCCGQSEPVECFVENMSMLTGILLNLLNPDHLIIGGGIPNMQGFPRKKFVRYLRKHARKPLPALDFELYFSTESPESGVLGASIRARNTLVKP